MKLYVTSGSEVELRGGFLHNQVLLAPVEGYFRQLGARIHREYPVTHGRKSRFVDLFVVYRGWKIVCEIELSAARVGNDLAKAIALGATILLIVVPNARVARAARKRLTEANLGVSEEGMKIFVLSLPHALQRLRDCFPLMTPVNVQESNQQKS